MIAEQISEMQTDNALLRNENESLRVEHALLLRENQTMRQDLVKSRAEAQRWMLKCNELQTLIEATSLALVHGIKRYKEAAREMQEENLGVDAKTAPEFLRPQPPAPSTENRGFRDGGAVVRTDIVDKRLPSLSL